MLRLSELFLTSLLLFTTIFSSNRPQIVEYSKDAIGDARPSKEPAASFLSLAAFAWVDSIIWNGYRNTYEASDVWDLPASDKAAKVLADFRHALLSSRLVTRLLLHHAIPLLVQGLWTVCSAVFTFAPTSMLKLILEYLEDRTKSSLNAVSLYVASMLVSGFLKAVAEGQASWLGTKVAVHLKGIIAGEKFSKSLKRKATADLVEKDQESNPSDDNTKDGPPGVPSIEKQSTTGKVANLMAVDTANIAEATSNFHLLWAGVPAGLVIGILLLYSL